MGQVGVLFTAASTTQCSHFLRAPFSFERSFLSRLFAITTHNFRRFFGCTMAVKVRHLGARLFRFNFGIISAWAIHRQTVGFRDFANSTTAFIQTG